MGQSGSRYAHASSCDFHRAIYLYEKLTKPENNGLIDAECSRYINSEALKFRRPQERNHRDSRLPWVDGAFSDDHSQRSRRTIDEHERKRKKKKRDARAVATIINRLPAPWRIVERFSRPRTDLTGILYEKHDSDSWLFFSGQFGSRRESLALSDVLRHDKWCFRLNPTQRSRQICYHSVATTRYSSLWSSRFAFKKKKPRSNAYDKLNIARDLVVRGGAIRERTPRCN